MGIIRYKGKNYTASPNDISDTEVVYESGDELDPSEPAEVPKLENRETLKSFAQKVSLTVKNVRYMFKMLGSTDISAIGDGTTTGAIKTLNEDISNITPASIGAFPGIIEIPDGADLNDYMTPGVYSGRNTYTYANFPSSTKKFSFTMIVSKAGIHTRQFISSANPIGSDDGEYIRYYNASSSDWKEWGELVTAVKGNAETEYRGGNVNLTPENIGALSLANGGTVEKNTQFVQGTLGRPFNGTSGTSGLIVFMEIKIVGGYANYPICFGLAGRGHGMLHCVVMFNSESNVDPTLHFFNIYGESVRAVYIKKIATSTYQLCTAKNEAYGHVRITYLHNININQTVISFPGTQINNADFVASEWTQATLGGKIKEAEQLSALLSTHSTDQTSTDYNYVGYKVSEADFKPLYNVSDGANYKQFYSRNWQHEIYGDYRTGQIALRGKNNGTFQAWRKVVDHLNYASLIPAATTSASGLMTKEDKNNLSSAMSTASAAQAAAQAASSATIPASRGGTGATTLAASVDALLAASGTESTDYAIKDNDSFIWTYSSANSNRAYKTKFTKLWNYVKSKLATVATTGSYNDLTNKPTIPVLSKAISYGLFITPYSGFSYNVNDCTVYKYGPMVMLRLRLTNTITVPKNFQYPIGTLIDTYRPFVTTPLRTTTAYIVIGTDGIITIDSDVELSANKVISFTAVYMSAL